MVVGAGFSGHQIVDRPYWLWMAENDALFQQELKPLSASTLFISK